MWHLQTTPSVKEDLAFAKKVPQVPAFTSVLGMANWEKARGADPQHAGGTPGQPAGEHRGILQEELEEVTEWKDGWA